MIPAKTRTFCQRGRTLFGSGLELEDAYHANNYHSRFSTRVSIHHEPSHTNTQQFDNVLNRGKLVYALEHKTKTGKRTDGSMRQLNEYEDYLGTMKSEDVSRLDRLIHHVRNLGWIENVEDDFTILEVVFS